MDFKQLFDTQEKLDAAIYEKHPEIKGQDNLSWMVLALQVELGELANEWRGFKKWSTDQEPRTKIKQLCVSCNGTGDENYEMVQEDAEGNGHHLYVVCEECNGTGEEGERNPLLEEYVDCLHFILTIGLELGVKPYKAYLLDPSKRDITHHISGLMTSAGILLVHSRDTAKQSYVPIFEDLIRLGLKLGFTLEQIEQAYYDKNQINHQRQASGY